MTRRIVLFLVLLLPLQFAWANAAAYCGHETTPVQTRHFGHHDHVHEAGAGQSSGKIAGDSDCGTCHASGAPLIVDGSVVVVPGPTTASVVPHSVPVLLPALARAPDRPQWTRLA